MSIDYGDPSFRDPPKKVFDSLKDRLRIGRRCVSDVAKERCLVVEWSCRLLPTFRGKAEAKAKPKPKA